MPQPGPVLKIFESPNGQDTAPHVEVICYGKESRFYDDDVRILLSTASSGRCHWRFARLGSPPVPGDPPQPLLSSDYGVLPAPSRRALEGL